MADAKKFEYEVGKSYRTQEGGVVRIVSRHTELRNYETVLGDDGAHRYDRSESKSDTGRVTGTAHDYSYPMNFVRPTTIVPDEA